MKEVLNPSPMAPEGDTLKPKSRLAQDEAKLLRTPSRVNAM